MTFKKSIIAAWSSFIASRCLSLIITLLLERDSQENELLTFAKCLTYSYPHKLLCIQFVSLTLLVGETLTNQKALKDDFLSV